MELYRLTKEKYGSDISGTGAFLAGGRWNSKGVRMLYTAGSRSLALVESLAHLVTVRNLESYVVMVLYVPDDAGLTVLAGSTLPADWRTDQNFTQRRGNRWVQTGENLLLQVPSAIVPKEYNFLLNPLHPQFNAVKIVDLEPFTFDLRLKNENE
jgi:RES domain-containing protein